MPITIDLLFLGQPGVVAAYLLKAPGDAALIEVGPASTSHTLLAALKAHGVRLDDVRHLLVTHVHLDHAGAAGVLAGHLPHAKVYAHEIGAPHLIDPARLVNSAGRIYGDLMERLWGTILPVPADRMVPLHDEQLLQVAGRRLQVLYTPGHAVHHVVFRDLDDGSMYTGDATGVRMQGCAYVRPATPPPDLDLEAWDSSLSRLAALRPTAFYLTHFGRAGDTQAHIQELRSGLRSWERLVLEGMQAGWDHAAITLAVQREGEKELSHGADAGIARHYETASSYAMNVSGYERYLRKRHPELPVPASRL